MKKQGVLIYDDIIGRMDIRFGPLDYYGGLHCGERLEVLCSEECKTINRNQRQLAYYYRKQSGQKAGEAI